MKGYWQSWANLVLAIWLFLSPWALAFTGTAAAAWNAYILGIAIAAVALIALAAMPDYPGWKWINLAFGAWLIISPWVLGFAAAGAAMGNAVIIGLAVIVLAGWGYASARAGHGAGTPR